ncbi:hypothetical protein [Candidatus Cetobacterium colombiensis]|uniref:Uncharacterized protein n=1 Tax=Candidatus Cetobacterium colombiensis TaxID=3073100 RepID=A0ABU4W9M7_9FUSO|nr:hypothetical protein [Candidatus Cetobacterium colombiensis]MDX8335198.1 hypothetical protein [Candidatus Cetobacterium colombiensis]
MKKLYLFLFFVLNFMVTFSSKGSTVDINTKLNIVKPTKIKIQKISDEDILSYKLDNSKGDLIKKNFQKNVDIIVF